MWHWVNAAGHHRVVPDRLLHRLAAADACRAKPAPTFLMGYIRFAHFAAGYILAVGLIGRTYWAIAGNHHARELYWVPLLTRAYWVEVLGMLKWYAFISPRPGRYVGHNPLARFAMFFGYLVLTVFMIVTGFALYGEGSQMGSWQERMFGWVIPLFGQSQDVHTWHHLGMWALVIFIIVHIYAAIREDIMGRSSVVSTMISGHRTFKD
jgi:Ni/Fe-hydrogenase 1 B-type cytochrome subunit